MSNWTFTIDTTIPFINIVAPINNSNISIINVQINYTVNDLNLD